MEDGEETDFRAEVFRIGGDGAQGLGGGAEENAVDDGLVLEGDVGNLFRYCKDDMEVRAVEKLGFALEDPVGAGQRLALGTVTIRAGVVTGPLEAAMITLFEM